jgi:WD40 repeat protein
LEPYTLSPTLTAPSSSGTWQLASRVWPFAGNGEGPDAVTFSPDGKIIATTGSDRSGANLVVRLWDVATRQPVGGPFAGGDDTPTYLSLA